jgi:hypothetical protein
MDNTIRPVYNHIREMEQSMESKIRVMDASPASSPIRPSLITGCCLAIGMTAFLTVMFVHLRQR